MKGFRKSTGIVYWVLRALAISSALLLFSVTGIVALQTASYATGVAVVVPTTTIQITSSAVLDTPGTTPPPIPTIATTPVPTPTTAPPTPTTAPPTPLPTQAPTPPPVPTRQPVPSPTGVPGAGSTPTPVVIATATKAALGPPIPLSTTPPGGTPKAKPSPTPHGSPTPNPTGTPAVISTQGSTVNPSNTQPGSTKGLMATIQPLILPIAGAGTTILLTAAGLFALMLWRKRTQGVTPQLLPSSMQSGNTWIAQQATLVQNNAQSTEGTPASNQQMLPFAMQSIAQYSPLLGAPDTSHLDAPAPPPVSDFRPLSLDYPQILEVHTDKTPIPVTPVTLQSLAPTTEVERQPALQLASTPFSPMPPSIEVDSLPTPVQAPIPSAKQNAPVAYQFPPHDSIMETLMHQAQMGIFALPGKEPT